MRFQTLAFLVILASTISGQCQTAVSTPQGAPRIAIGDLRRENDPKFSKTEKELIATARRNLELRDKRPVDAYYNVRKTAKGYEVGVYYTAWDGSKPIFAPGNFCVVALDRNFRFVTIYPGA